VALEEIAARWQQIGGSTRSLGRARLPLERFIESPGLGLACLKLDEVAHEIDTRSTVNKCDRFGVKGHAQ